MVVTTDASSFGSGGWWRLFGHASKPQHEAQGFQLPLDEDMRSDARELSGVKLTVKAGPEHLATRC